MAAGTQLTCGYSWSGAAFVPLLFTLTRSATSWGLGQLARSQLQTSRPAATAAFWVLPPRCPQHATVCAVWHRSPKPQFGLQGGSSGWWVLEGCCWKCRAHSRLLRLPAGCKISQ